MVTPNGRDTMMTQAEQPVMPALEALLQQTANMAAKADPLGLPSIERGVDQLVEATSRLAKKSSRSQQGNESLETARFMASKGIDTQMLNSDLKQFEIQPTLEEVLPESCTLEEWMSQVHQISILSAVRESQARAQEGFKQRLLDIVNLGWQNSRSKFVVASQLNHERSSRTGAPTSGRQQNEQDPTMSSRSDPYVSVMEKINRAMASGIPADPLQDILKFIANMGEADGENAFRHTSLKNLWQVVASVLSPTKPGIHPETKEEIAAMRASLCKSARRHLEKDYATYVTEEIERHPQVAMLGGSPSRIQQIRAFLRIRLSDKGSLDFDFPGGIDTFWHQLYFCLRCGYVEEAIQLALSMQDSAFSGDVHGTNLSSLSEHIREWHDKGELSATIQAMVRLDGERILREQDRTSFGKNQFRILIYTILCADRHLAESLLSDQYLFTNIEDFLWFKLILVREGQVSTLTSTIYANDEPHRLAELQQQLSQYPPTYYTREGKEPLLYAVLLVLTLQFKAVINYLATYTQSGLQGGIFPYFVEAVHLCIIFNYYGVFNLAGDVPAKAVIDCADLVHQYGQKFANQDPATAFGYYCLAAEVKGGGYVSVVQMQGQLLRELLMQSRAFGTLLGAGGSGSGATLSKLKPDKQQRQDIIMSAAVGCMQNAQYDEAIELFMLADKPLNSLEIINKKYAEVISVNSGAATASGDDLEQRGNGAIAALEQNLEVDLQAKKSEIKAFMVLNLTRKLFGYFKSSAYDECYKLVAEYTFLPIRQEQVSKYASDAAYLHLSIKEKLPQIVKIAGASIAEILQERRSTRATPRASVSISSSNQELKTRLHCLALYAGCVKIIPENIATELNILLNSV